ncbi:hypothetical protein [Mobilicoccus massiliensis]|uniref:hypothetical protein n=1 Tax=Mobilicoccus massiliensis TaxID=1522310 RepID=UPI00058C3349|nr:hypothetical protein [Mobilicoccus massiliensis]
MAAENAWTWRCEDASGTSVESDVVPTSGFPGQGEAEAWLSESWAELADAGVEQVSLLEGDRVVYGPMSLAGG